MHRHLRFGREGRVHYLPGRDIQTATTVNYSYDAMSRLVGAGAINEPFRPGGCTPAVFYGSLKWAQNGAYNAAGQLVGLERVSNSQTACPSTVTTYFFNQAWQCNALNQLTEIDTSTQSGGYPVGSGMPGLASSFFARYVYSTTANNGQISQATDARLGYSVNYVYDPLKRLKSATSAGPWTQSYAYDGFGNLTGKTAPTGSAEPTLPGINSANNQLTGLTYDANGNATALNAFALGYDMENRLVTSTSGSLTETNVYDESNRRIQQLRTAGGVNSAYFYGPGGQLLTFMKVQPGTPGVTTLTYNNVYFGSMLLGSLNVRGAASTMTDRLGTATAGYPYGTDISGQTAQFNPGTIDFATYLNDSSTGLEYANQRWYSTGYGRFLTVDSSSGSTHLRGPSASNSYTYGSNDPVNRVDPMGTCDVIVGGIRQGPRSINDFLSGKVVALPYSSLSNSDSFLGSLQGVLQVAAQVLGPTSSTFAAVFALTSAAADGHPINVTTFSGGAQAFTVAVNYLNSHGQQSTTSLISSITYVSPGSVAIPLYNNGNVAVLLGNDVTDFLATGFSMYALLGVKAQVAQNCGHDFGCIVSHFRQLIPSGQDCTSPTPFLQNSSGITYVPGLFNGDPFAILNYLGSFVWTQVKSTIYFPVTDDGN